jgi:hypothetical protein
VGPGEYVRYPQEGHELSRSGHPKRRMNRLNNLVTGYLITELLKSGVVYSVNK